MDTPLLIPLRNLRPGKNPRTVMNPAELEELKEAIRAQGILQPILVRPLGNNCYEIVAGYRRYYSACALFDEDWCMPALCRVLTDEQAEAAAATENKIREAMSALDDAESAARTLAYAGGSRAEAARRLGCSVSALDKSLALMHASDNVRKALKDGKIYVGHAELLAVCRKEAQDLALVQLLSQPNLMLVNELKSFMEKTALHLKGAIFCKDDCLSCHHNSDNQSALFAEAISDGRCTNKKCFSDKTDAQLQASVDALKDEYQIVKIVRAGDNHTVAPLLANGDKGVGEAQALACKTCKNFGAVVSAVPDTLGKVYKQMCLDTPCNQKMVQARIDAERLKAKLANEATKSPAGKSPNAAPATVTKSGAAKTVTPEPSGRLKEYREKVWRLIFSRVVGKMSVVDNRSVLLSIVLSRPGVLDSHALTEAIEGSIPGLGAAHSFKKGLAKVRALSQEQLGAALQQVAAHVSAGSMGLGIEDVTAVLASFEVDIGKHWLVDKDFFGLLTKNEIDAVCGEIAIKQTMGAEYAKAKNGSKEDYIKAILAIPNFEYRGRVPKLMCW